MTATPEQRPSQSNFEEALRKRLSQHREAGATVPDVERVRNGIDLADLDEIVKRLGLSQEALERTLCVSARTLARRRKGDRRLTLTESDRLWRLLHVFNLALEAFEDDEDRARTWLMTPKAVLRGETPLARLDTEPGLREVEDMLTVIDETAAA